MSAAHSKQEFMGDGGVIHLKEGQLFTGRKQLSRETGISETTVERILKVLENEHQIGQQKTTKYRIITILNWSKWQQTDITSDNKRTTNGQQTDTYKNDKKVKNDKKDTAQSADAPISLKEEVEKLYASERRDLNIIGWYFEKRKPDIRTKAQLQKAIKRHLRAAQDLSPFSDEQIGKAHRFVAVEYPEWTIETLSKKLTK